MAYSTTARALTLLAVVALASASATYNDLKAKNAAYLASTPQFRHTGFDEEGYLADVAHRRRARALLQFDGAPGAPESEDSGAPGAPEAEEMPRGGFVKPYPRAGQLDNVNSDCPGEELYGPFGNYYICPIAYGDCKGDADGMLVDALGPFVTGVWHTIPTTMRGTWEEAEYWSVPSLMAKGMGQLSNMCQYSPFEETAFPTCEPLGASSPYSAVCAFDRLYKIDYWAMWYMWAAWDLKGDESEYIIPSSTYANDGTEATTKCYQSKIFFPINNGASRHLLQCDEADVVWDETLLVYTCRQPPSLKSTRQSNMGADIAAMQGMFDDLEDIPAAGVAAGVAPAPAT